MLQGSATSDAFGNDTSTTVPLRGNKQASVDEKWALAKCD